MKLAMLVLGIAVFSLNSTASANERLGKHSKITIQYDAKFGSGSGVEEGGQWFTSVRQSGLFGSHVDYKDVLVLPTSREAAAVLDGLDQSKAQECTVLNGNLVLENGRPTQFLVIDIECK